MCSVMGVILKEILEPLEQNTPDHLMLMETSSINTFRNSRAGECCRGFGAMCVRAQTFSMFEAECCALLKEPAALLRALGDAELFPSPVLWAGTTAAPCSAWIL